MKTKVFFAATFMAFGLLAMACSGDEPKIDPEDVFKDPVPEQPATPEQPGNTGETLLPEREKPTFEGKMIVGYYPTWGTWWGEPDYDKVSLICIAFAEMRGDGHLYYDDARNLKGMIDKAHKGGSKVVISLRDAQNVSKALADEKLRKNLAKEVKECIAELDLDGVDVDYEEWGGDDNGKCKNLEEFYKDIRAQIGDGYLLTAAVSGATDNSNRMVSAQLLSHLDYVFPMVYDQCGGWAGGGWGSVGQHSSLEYFKDVVDYFIDGLGLPKEKLCPGVPFYGYEFKSATSTADAGAVAYRELFDRFPNEDVMNSDNIGLIWYNGVPTITAKCQYALDKDIAGVMIWELTQDTRVAEKSLLNAMHETLRK